MSDVSFDISPLLRWIRKLEDFGGTLQRGMEPAFKQGATYMLGSVLKNFQAQGRPTPWAPHGPMTEMVRGKNAKILRDTGRLMTSIVGFYDQDAGTFGAQTNVEYAALMDKGGISSPGEVVIPKQMRTSKKGKDYAVKAHAAQMKGGYPVPARPFFVVQDEDRTNLTTIFADFIMGSLKRG